MKPLPEKAPHCTYEEAVLWLREQPEYAELVPLAYLDRDNASAAKRFRATGECEETLEVLGMSRGTGLSVLDLGCGNGIASAAFRGAGHRVVALDVDMSDDVGLRAAQRLGATPDGPPLRCVGGVAEDLPFRDRSFDAVYARQALHHFRDLARGVAECARVLRPGGIFLAAREHVVSDDVQLAAFLKSHPLQALHGGESAYPEGKYAGVMEAAGLDVLAVLGPFESPLNQFPTTDEEIRGWMRIGLSKRMGHALSGIVSRTPFLLGAYKRRLSRKSTEPGRLFSFLCRKPG